MKLNLNIKRASLLLLGVIVCSVVSAQKVDPKGNVLSKDSNKQDTTKTLNAQQKNSASIADGVSASGSTLGIRGRIIDVETMQPISGVSVSLADNSKATSTNENGEFIIPVNKKGIYEVVSSYLGYNKEVTPVVLADKNWENISVVLVNESSTLDEVVVTRRRVQASEIALLEERKNSNLFVEKIGAQELSRKGVGDAAAAVSKISGVSRQEGSNQIYVRGLGDRYNSSSLNGMPIPSSNPSEKNLPLDLFSTDIIDFVSVDKVHNATLSGDFGGAGVDIVTKNYTGDKLVEISLGSGVNTNAIAQSGNFLLQRGPGYFGHMKSDLASNPTQSYFFQNGLNQTKKTPVPSNFGIRVGNSYRFGSEGRFGFFATANFANGFEYREGINQNVSAQAELIKSFNQKRSSYKTNSTGLLGLNFSPNSKNRINYNLVYINSSNQFYDEFSGYMVDLNEDGMGLLQRSTFDQNRLIINQLLGDHKISDRFDVKWGAAYNSVEGNMPDRVQTILGFNEAETGFEVRYNDPTNNHRYYHKLNEGEFVANLLGSYLMDEDGRGKLSVGYQGRFKRRDFEAIQLNLNIASEHRFSTLIDPYNRDAFYNAENYSNGFFTIQSFAGDAPMTYEGKQDIHAAFANVDYKLSEKLVAVLGLRYERIGQLISWYTNRGPGESDFNRNGYLPSLSLKYEVSPKQNLRLAASKTYTLPQFKERARFVYEEVTEQEIGNPYLYPSQNYNLDLKWELFPTSAELLSVGAFGKYIQDPINRITLASSDNLLSYVNVGDLGYVYGLELEIRKNIIDFGTNRGRFSTGVNTSVMKTHQDLDSEKVNRESNNTISIYTTDNTSNFTGASNFLVNADLSFQKNFSKGGDFTATVVYNYFSDKLYSIGSNGRGNLVDKGISTLDAVFKTKLNNRFGIDLTARNLLNPSFERDQQNPIGDVTILSYRKGAMFNLGLNYKF
ncbi:TonB-dependent receptor [Sphingobacterium olei]|uniref:TonB-dependent receptor n=1 Tax=Sphingobacterium olei TaxID=2571155 RepID=A0A4V5MML8_9SPHI|nr:TonB-dependent receptor [Sphingobacterium olei]TJZ61438.1 TonB-dependent receptor [Sphingobacterium olei]